MTDQAQRYCPVCDRPFLEGEAVLACASCHVAHHPGCWVKNEGCVVDAAHPGNPVPTAFHREPFTPEPLDPGHPTAVPAPPPAAPAPRRDPLRFEPRPADNPAPPPSAPPQAQPPQPPPQMVPGPPPSRPAPGGGVIGQETAPTAGAPPRRYRAAPPVSGGGRGRGRGGGLGRLGEHESRSTLSGLLRYWYVPVAAFLAIGVAVGVIWGIDFIAGGDDDDDDALPAAGSETPAAGTTPDPNTTPTAVPTPSGDTTPVPTEIPVPDGRFASGATVLVTGTGDCLRVRSAAGLTNEVVDCVPDGTEMTVLQGPETIDDLDWWLVEAPSSQGWAADLYFVEAP